MMKILTIIFSLLGLCAIGASVTSTEIGNLHDYHNVVTNVDLSGLATSKDLETVKTNAIVKNRGNKVDVGFSIEHHSINGEDVSLNFGWNDPSGSSIVMNRLYSTAPASYFENRIVFIPTPNNKESLLSRIKEYSSAGKNASNEVVSIVSSAVAPVGNAAINALSSANFARDTANTAISKAATAMNLATTATNLATTAVSMISETNETFSTAVLAVGLNIDTNSVAVINEIADTFGGLPIGGTATTVGGLLAALAAAVAWLRKNKADKEHTHEVSDVTGLQNAIDARLPYPLYSVPSTGELKDRAINTTSLASVTVSDNFTDLLIRASVGSSLPVTMPEAITKYGDAFPSEAGEYLITITKTGTAEAYVRTIKLEVAQ